MFQRKHDSFSEWYREVLFDADILDQRFPVKGCNVWRSYGTEIMQNVMNLLEDLLDETGHRKMYFPLLISETIFGKESQHLKGFEDQVFWVERAGKTKLSRKLVVRPTSETAMYHMFSIWVRSHADLPIKAYQTVSVFRHETKSTKPLIRDREMWPFNEAHTVHSTIEEAEKQIEIGMRLYEKLFKNLALRYLLVKKPEWELFPGAVSAYEFYTLMPDGKVLETGSVNNLGQAFSKVFSIVFETKDGGRDYAYQTCYGQSERLLASVITIHGDDHGLVLPSAIAPTPVVIIPIVYADHDEGVLDYAARAKAMLIQGMLTVRVDQRNMTAGEKFYYWEKRGVPIRLEIGSREVSRKTVTIVQRTNLKRREVDLENLLEEVQTALQEIDQELLERSERSLKKSVTYVSDLSEVRRRIQERMRIFCLPFCGKDSCRLLFEEETAMDIIGYDLAEIPADAECAACRLKANHLAYLAKSY